MSATAKAWLQVRSRARKHRRRRWPAVVLAAGVVAGAAGCTTPRSSLGTSDAPCFVALPTASSAVRHHGHFDGVRLLSWDEVHRSSNLYRTVLARNVRSPQRLCLVAYTGIFTRAAVQRPSGHRKGRLAIVVVEYPQDKLLATILLRRSPTHFGHFHIAG